jgi:hypothetical protein
MGWPTTSTMCAAEGHRDGRQRGFTPEEVGRLAAIFGVSSWQLLTRCANGEGQPPTGSHALHAGCAGTELPPSRLLIWVQIALSNAAGEQPLRLAAVIIASRSA